jgi:two-component system chemotaxis response regulator CheB
VKRIRVLIVDDSATVRQVLAQVLGEAPDIEVIGVAADPLFALDKMNRDWPDVVVLDVEMPRMDGITFLRKIMVRRPTRIVICSSLTEASAQTTMEALAAGALGIVTKPRVGVRDYLQGAAAELIGAVRAAAQADLRRLATLAQRSPAKHEGAANVDRARAMHETTDKVVAIGTSTGGTQALEVLLRDLPPTVPGLVIVQHMPEKFTAAFAERLDRVCRIEVREARHGDRVLPGLALIAPGARHMQLTRNGAQYQVQVAAGPAVNRHCPSVDVLFRSVAQYAGRNALGIIMTGMGDDGARGLLQMRQAQASTLGQDEETCVVYGMPKEAVRMGAVQRSLPLGAIANAVIEYGMGR